MPLKLQRPPDVANYAYQDSEEVVATRLDGGASRFRADILNATGLLNAKWTVGGNDFEYLRAFSRAARAESFLVDLCVDTAEPVEHTAHFIGGLRHIALGAGVFEVSATLEVSRNEEDDDFNEALVALQSAFGIDDADILTGLDSLAHLVNVDLPTTEPV